MIKYMKTKKYIEEKNSYIWDLFRRVTKIGGLLADIKVDVVVIFYFEFLNSLISSCCIIQLKI